MKDVDIMADAHERGMVTGIFALVALFAAGKLLFTDPDVAQKHLEAEGYTNIQVQGGSWWRCGVIPVASDFYANYFEADHPVSKKPVRGAVCRGGIAGSYVRLDDLTHD